VLTAGKQTIVPYIKLSGSNKLGSDDRTVL